MKKILIKLKNYYMNLIIRMINMKMSKVYIKKYKYIMNSYWQFKKRKPLLYN
jgi:hypothetical protein